MRIGPYHFSMRQYENKSAEELQFLASAIKKYAEQKQELENCEAALYQFIVEQIKFIEDDYNCIITFNGHQIDDEDLKIQFTPFEE